MRTLFVSDLDGTLLHSEGCLSDRTRRVLGRVTEAGALFTYATARSVHSARIVTQGWRPSLPVIVYNGVMILGEKAETPLVFNTFSAEERGWLRGSFKEAKISPLVYAFVEGRERVSWREDRTNKGTEAYLAKRRNDRRLRPCMEEEALFSGEAFYYTCIGTREELVPLYERLERWGRCRLTFQRELYGQGEWWLEVMPYQATKAHAALQLKEWLGCERLVVFGDGLNDLPLFQVADACYAMENGAQALKERATGILKKNDEDGVALWLEEHLLNV